MGINLRYYKPECLLFSRQVQSRLELAPESEHGTRENFP